MELASGKTNNKSMITDQNSIQYNKNKYTKEFKVSVVDAWYSGFYNTIADCARNYSLNQSTLYYWIKHSKDLLIPEGNITMAKLQKEIAETKIKLQVLIYTAAYFSQNMK